MRGSGEGMWESVLMPATDSFLKRTHIAYRLNLNGRHTESMAVNRTCLDAPRLPHTSVNLSFAQQRRKELQSVLLCVVEGPPGHKATHNQQG